jgi:hypothetical protein
MKLIPNSITNSDQHHRDRYKCRWLLNFWLVTAQLMLSGCLGLHGPCDVPEALVESEVIGVWQADYDNYTHDYTRNVPDAYIKGVEQISIQRDGAYTQTFESPDFTYHSSANKWRLVDDNEGPKLEMQGLRYFANGIEISVSRCSRESLF